MLDGEDQLLRSLLDGEVMFFAGSGISYASGLPTVEDVRSATIDALLPAMDAGRRAYRSRLQAEQFYSILLEVTGSWLRDDIGPMSRKL